LVGGIAPVVVQEREISMFFSILRNPVKKYL
jgi:hypothetical protein